MEGAERIEECRLPGHRLAGAVGEHELHRTADQAVASIVIGTGYAAHVHDLTGPVDGPVGGDVYADGRLGGA